VLGSLVIFGTLALTPPLGILVVAGFVGGLLFGPINPLASTVIQEHTPPQMLGRVFGALTALAQGGIPIGAVLAGVVVQRAGLVPTIVGMGVLYLLVPLACSSTGPYARWTRDGAGRALTLLRQSSDS
jgi:MFS family permease